MNIMAHFLQIPESEFYFILLNRSEASDSNRLFYTEE